VDFNFPRKEGEVFPYPKLVCPNIAVLNPLEIMGAIQSIASSTVDMIQPDDDTENWFRKKCGLPQKGKVRARFAPIVQRVTEEESGTPQEIESGNEKPAPGPRAQVPVKTEEKKPKSAQMSERHPLQDRKQWHGFDVSIENVPGSRRSGTGPDGQPWEVTMKHPYGYLRKTEGVDGDQVDCFLGPDSAAEFVYVIHTKDPVGGEYDEDKCMLDFPSAESAKQAFLDNYDSGDHFNSMTVLPVDEFIQKVKKTLDHPGKITASEQRLVTRRDILPHEKHHDFSGHARRQDATQTAIRRILAGALPGLVRSAAQSAAGLTPKDLDRVRIPWDQSLVNRIARSCEIAHKYGYNQVFAERYRATKRSRKQVAGVKLSAESAAASAAQDKPSLIAEVAISDLNNWIASRVRAAGVDGSKLGMNYANALQFMIDEFEEQSMVAMDRIAAEASRSSVAGGRYSAFEELESEIAKYVRSEAMDKNTCVECAAHDGDEWDSLKDVDWSPGDDCEGGDMCRGQLMPVFEDENTVELG
jgi:hypothetical protein